LWATAETNMNCRETLAEAYLYLDGEILSQRRRLEIAHHLEECGPCLERYGLEKEVTLIVGRLRGLTHCPDELKIRIANLIQEV
jgi:mycothiol system anti-sigma-R factor